jgi:hypothetical protein
MPLRNFGLSFSRRPARTNAGVAWRPSSNHELVVAGLLLVLIVLVVALICLWLLAH